MNPQTMFTVCMCVMVLSACAGVHVPMMPADRAPDFGQTAAFGSVARQHLTVLAEDIGARLPGSEEETQAAEYIQETLDGYGYTPKMQYFDFTSEEETLESANVIAVRSGASPMIIVVGAHYDSTDDGDGVDDNASGVAVLLEVAYLLRRTKTPYTIRFIAFGAEENDLDGSRYYVDNLSQKDLDNMIAMINLDSLSVGDINYVYGDGGPGSLRDWLIKDAQRIKFRLASRPASILDEDDGSSCECADFFPFQEAEIPFVYFESTNLDLDEEGYMQVAEELGADGEIRHTEYDTLDYIDSTFPGRINQHFKGYVTLLYDALMQFKANK